jgi:hypothetical protein
MGDQGGEQVAIIRATPECSDAEWKRMYETIIACINVMKTSLLTIRHRPERRTSARYA